MNPKASESEVTTKGEKSQLEMAMWEIDYRRKKQWDIFSWSSTLLVAIIGGTIALKVGAFVARPMPRLLKSVIVIAASVLATEAITWITHNDKREMVATEQLDAKTKAWLQYATIWGLTYSSRVVIGLLWLAVILAVLVRA